MPFPLTPLPAPLPPPTITVTPNEPRTLLAVGSHSGLTHILARNPHISHVGDSSLLLHSAPAGASESTWVPAASIPVDPTAPGSISAVGFAPPHGGALVATGSSSGVVCIWAPPLPVPSSSSPPTTNAWPPTTNTWDLVVRLHATGRRISAVTFHPDASYPLLAVGSEDGYVRIYAPTGRQPAWDLAYIFSPGLGVGGQDGCDAVTNLSWRPGEAGETELTPALAVATAPISPGGGDPLTVPAGAGGSASVWALRAEEGRWVHGGTLVEGPCTDVAWARGAGVGFEVVSVASGTSVHVCSVRGALEEVEVASLQVLEMARPAWRVEWDMLGLDLAIGLEGGGLSLWELRLSGDLTPTLGKMGVLDGAWVERERQRRVAGA